MSMDNADFRRLVSGVTSSDSGETTNKATRSGALAFTPRKTGGIPLTPRNRHGPSAPEFARQFALQNNVNRPGQAKKFKSSVPKGMKLAEGYRDRTQDRREDESTTDDLGARLKALEDQVKLGQLERADFERRRDQLTAGDVTKTHLVKGLDRKLLERVRRGENVLEEPDAEETAEADDTPKLTAEEELEELEKKEITAKDREKTVKKGELAPPPPVAGAKRSRNDILADWKAQRKAESEAKAAANQLGDKFRKIGNKSSGPSQRIERDSKGREVLITVDEHGRTKRKVRRIDDVPSKKATPLGADVQIPTTTKTPVKPSTPAPAIEDDDSNDDIFQDAGDDYDPLGNQNEDLSSDSSDDDDNDDTTEKLKPKPTSTENPAAAPSESTTKTTIRRNYFNDNPESPSDANEAKEKPFSDPTILAALQRAAAIAKRRDADQNASDDEDNNGQKKSSDKPQQSTAAERLLARHDRDLDDMDMGFGGSRMEDEEDGEGGRIKLSKWTNGGGGDADDEKQWKARGGQGQRKRGKTKKKGDKNSAADVLSVMERRR